MKSPLDILMPYQRKWVDDDSRFKIGLWSRQTGKDFSTSCEAVRDCLMRPKIKWMIAAPSERQSMESLEKCKDWAEAFETAIADEQIEREAGPKSLMKSGSITFANGSQIIAVPGKPSTVRGMSCNLILTEFAFFENPDETWRGIYPSLTNPLRGGQKKLRIITTPNGKTGSGARTFNIMDQNYYNPDPNRKLHWGCHLVDIYKAVADGLPIDVEELKEALDDPEGWDQEYLVKFIDGSSVLLPYDIIANAESVDAQAFGDPNYFDCRTSDYRLGIDFGRTNDPTVCWTLGNENGTWVTKEVLVLKGMDTPDQMDILRSRIKNARHVCFDYTGPGIGLGDLMAKEFGRHNPSGHEFGKVELCTFSPNFKRLIFPRLRQAFSAPAKLRIPIDVDVREDLHAMQQKINNGAYSYDAPRTAAGHSDRCTALALAWRACESGSNIILPSTWSATGSMKNIARQAFKRMRRYAGIRTR